MRYFCSIIAAAFLVMAGAVVISAQETAPKVIHGGILNGKAVSLPKPEYPDDARNAGVDGIVRVEVTIDENGNVESAAALKEETPDTDLATATVDARASLREAAERAALEAKFSPTFLNGQPVKVKGTITYNFSLDAKPENESKAIKGGILNGKATELPKPEYPEAARAVKASGIVRVQVTVDESGNVIAAEAISGHPLLQSAAVAAARHARFSPTMVDGPPVKVVGIITYNFVLPAKPQ